MIHQEQKKWRDAIDQVLAENHTPMHYTDISDRIIELKLRKNLGATPHATVIAQITSSIKHEGEKSPYLRVAKGTFTLKPSSTPAKPGMASGANETQQLETEEQYEIFSSFGMFWRRDKIIWNRQNKLLGRQDIDSVGVDFHSQIGIYLLYDGREVIYVGRTTDRCLGTRLFEHTANRLSTKWDRFSWFGLKPVSEDGKLLDLPAFYKSEHMIPALEAVLVEALEPRQNRKRGDDLAAVEYMQADDPEMEKRQLRTSLDRFIGQ